MTTRAVPFFLEVDPNIMNKISDLYQRTDSLKQDVTILKKWLETQPHLPEMMSEISDDKSIENIFVLCKCSIEKAKQRIGMYYTVRDKLPDMYENTNPKSLQMKETMDIAYYVPLPKMTKEMYRVLLFKIRTESMVDNLEVVHLHRLLLSTFELRLNEDIMMGDIHVIDMSGIPLSYMLRLNPFHLRKFLFIYEAIYSLPLKGIYFINSPPYIDIMIAIFKKLLKPKLFDRIQVYQDDSILMTRFPKEILPKDYGGEEKSMEELQQFQKQKFLEYEDRFDLLDTLKVDESRRPEKLKNDETLGFHGNFKKLDLD